MKSFTPDFGQWPIICLPYAHSPKGWIERVPSPRVDTEASLRANLTAGIRLRIGIDFDNTIITYDEVFCALAKSHGLLDTNFYGCKQAVRDAIRRLPNGEAAWQHLQGLAYGKGIRAAKIVAGVDAFLRRCRAGGCEVAIVSHKTEYGHFDQDRVNLREAASDWMLVNGIIDVEQGIASSNVFFEATRAKKLERIAALSCTHFIDDLEEVLTDPAFPPNVERILLSQGKISQADDRYKVCSTWRDVEECIFARN
jgi:hypothetical protein